MTDDDYREVLETVKRLHDVNFGDGGIIQLRDYSREKTSFSSFLNSHNSTSSDDPDPCYNASEIRDYCRFCSGDDMRPNANYKDEEYANCRLYNISHGSHSIDFMESFEWGKERTDNELRKWNDTPVLFLMENPSLDYGIYTFLEDDRDHSGKRPSKKWYWIHRSNKGKEKEYEGDKYLSPRVYGEMVMSLILQNKLANAYMTNVVKCGMCDSALFETGFSKADEKVKKYLGTAVYTDGCKRNCVQYVLEKEIKALVGNKNRLVIFAFGENSFWLIRDYIFSKRDDYLKGVTVQLIQLPHPVAREKNLYRRFLLKRMVSEALNDSSFEQLTLGTDIEKDIVNVVKEGFSKVGIRCEVGEKKSRRRKEALLIKYDERNTLFDNGKNAILGVSIFADMDEEILDGEYWFGYSTVDGYWVWDEKVKKYVDLPTGKLADCFNLFRGIMDTCLQG